MRDRFALDADRPHPRRQHSLTAVANLQAQTDADPSGFNEASAPRRSFHARFREFGERRSTLNENMAFRRIEHEQAVGRVQRLDAYDTPWLDGFDRDAVGAARLEHETVQRWGASGCTSRNRKGRLVNSG